MKRTFEFDNAPALLTSSSRTTLHRALLFWREREQVSGLTPQGATELLNDVRPVHLRRRLR